MASGIDFSAVPELEEKLFCALTYGPYEQNEGLLDSVDDVDVRMLNHKTLLHVGVRLGKVDWVEELLARGADPNLEDDCHLTVMSLAEEMLRRFPEDSDHRQVRTLLSMVHRRDQAMRHRLRTPYVRSALSSTPLFLSEQLSVMADLSSSASALKEEMRSLVVELRSSLEELKEKLCGREELMQRFDVVVTSSIEDLTSLSDCLPEETTLGAVGTTTSETPLPQSIMADERSNCVDGMMRRTVIAYGGEEGVRRMRKLYERLYDGDVVTECLLQFLHRESRFVAKVDCDSEWIERIMETWTDVDGTRHSGSGVCSLTDFFSNTVYLGAKVDEGKTEKRVEGSFASALARMSLHLCFENEGKPYEEGDNVRKAEMKRALKEAKDEKRKRGDRLHPFIRSALDRKTQAMRESYLAASVPRIIAEHGSTDGIRMFGDQVPRLLHYFKEHVVATLHDQAGEPLQLQQPSLRHSGENRSVRHRIQNFIARLQF